jgi:putative component of membrane protein insertase Oxa1/YidC/SpoIIIJ protein YidD
MVKILLLSTIRIYRLMPKRIRPHCLFKESCSCYVQRVTKEKGGKAGWEALILRIRQCRPGMVSLTLPNGEGGYLLADGSWVPEKLIA